MNLLTKLERKLSEMLAEDALRRVRRRALDIAMDRFEKLHPAWHESLFDRSFVRRVFSAQEEEIDATMLAREWTRRFRYQDERKRERDVRQLEPVADSFLRLLIQAEHELDGRLQRGPTRMSERNRLEPHPC